MVNNGLLNPMECERIRERKGDMKIVSGFLLGVLISK